MEDAQQSKWIKIAEAENMIEANILTGMLASNQIEVKVLNKQDSMYLNLNMYQYVEIYVQQDDAMRAQRLLLANE